MNLLEKIAADCSQPAAICDVSALKAVGQLSASALVAVVLTENDTGKPQGGRSEEHTSELQSQR